MLRYFALLVSFVLAPLATAQADVLAEGHAMNLVLANTPVTVYYMANGDAYEFVTTLAANGVDGGRPMRFVSSLSNGESHEFSIGSYGSDGTLTIMRVHRDGEKVSVDVGTKQSFFQEGATQTLSQ